MISYTIFDLESTGLNVKLDEIMQIAAFKVVPVGTTLEIKEIVSEYVNTDRRIDPGALAAHGITKEIVQEKSAGLYLDSQFAKVKHLFTSESILIGHNINSFDVKLLENDIARSGYESLCYKGIIDTYAIARKYMVVPLDKRQNGRKLSGMYDWACDLFKLDQNKLQKAYTKLTGLNPQCHNALYDVYMTYIIAAKLHSIGKLG